MRRIHRLALYVMLAVMLAVLVLAGCARDVGQRSGGPLSTVPSVLVSSTMQNPQGIAAGYGKLTLTALDPGSGSVRWRYQTDWHPYQLVGAPVEADGIVYTVSDPVPSTSSCPNVRGNLVALGESDGRQLWSVSVGPLLTPPVVANGVVYTSALTFDDCATPRPQQDIKSYYALRASDGHQLWRTNLTQDTTDTNPDDSIGPDTSLQFVDGVLVAVSEANISDTGSRVGHIFAFDAATGKLRWKNTFFSDQSIFSLVANGLLIVRTHPADKPVQEWTAYRVSDGQQVWKVSGGYSGQFLATGDVIYADASDEAASSTPQQPVFDTRVVALNTHTGQQLWRVDSDINDINAINSLLAVHADTVYAQLGPSPFTEKDAGHWNLEGLDAQSGQVRWRASLPWLLGRELLTDAALFGYSDDMLPGEVMALDPGDGHTIWSVSIQATGYGGNIRSLALGNGALYAADEGSTVTAIRAQNGAILWKAKIEGTGVEMTVVG